MMFVRGFAGNRGCFGYGFHGGPWGIMIMGGIVLLVVVAIIYFSRNNIAKKASDASLESLKMKLVQGEITDEEFLKIKNILKDK